LSDTQDLGPVPERISVGVAQVRRLIDEQLPQWAGLALEPVAHGGWDNVTFHLGADMLVRLPSAAAYALAVEKEHRWLPVLATQLPLPIPVPLAKGSPTQDYPHRWSVYRWLDGVTAARDRIADPVRFAVDLAAFLAALQSVDTADGPQPGVHNWFRGGNLSIYDHEVQSALEQLDGRVDAGLAREIWVTALDARWDGPDRWLHGDVAEGNLLLLEGQLAAVIDFGTCGVGDPACDLAIAWTLLTAQGRQAFRDRLSVDEASWARGRGWALWKALATCSSTYADPEDAEEFAHAEHVLDEIWSEYSGSRSTARSATSHPPI
jgi:aminoglycoside phosphotransferase (APT) family kinase protein